MSDLGIRQDFIEGVHEVFSTLFNVGSSDGILFYPLNDEELDIYGEIPYKEYKEPYNLIAQVRMNPQEGINEVAERKYDATFVIPLKSFMDNNIDVSRKNLLELQKGVICWDGIYYKIELITPKAFVEDVFLLYDFNCVEDKELDTIVVYKSEEAEDEEFALLNDDTYRVELEDEEDIDLIGEEDV